MYQDSLNRENKIRHVDFNGPTTRFYSIHEMYNRVRPLTESVPRRRPEWRGRFIFPLLCHPFLFSHRLMASRSWVMRSLGAG